MSALQIWRGRAFMRYAPAHVASRLRNCLNNASMVSQDLPLCSLHNIRTFHMPKNDIITFVVNIDLWLMFELFAKL